MEHYYERMAAISDFIVHTIPAAEGRKYSDLILDYDHTLGNQVVISYAAYNSQNPLVK